MSDKEILTKAIEKAITGGWHFDIDTDEFEIFLDTSGSPSISQSNGLDLLDYQRIIFNHDFAKAIAGDEWTKFLCDLVVEPDPIQELAKWL